MGKFFKTALSKAFLFRAAEQAERKAKIFTKIVSVPKKMPKIVITDPIKYKKYRDQANRIIMGIRQRQLQQRFLGGLPANHPKVRAAHTKEMAAQAKANKIPGTPAKLEKSLDKQKNPIGGDILSKIRSAHSRGIPYNPDPSIFWD